MNDIFLLSVICLVAMVSPGPDFILATRNSLMYPRLHALATALGIIAGCVVHSTYCILGLAFLITKSIVVYSAIKYAGAAYLIFLGIRGILSRDKTESAQVSRVQKEVSIKAAFLQGLLCNLLNPKLAIFLLSLFTQFIPVDAGIFEKLTVAGVFVIESVIYWPLLVLFFQLNTLRLAFIRFQHSVERVFGVLLLALGIRVAVSEN